MLSPSVAPSPEVSVAPSVSVNELATLVGGVDPSERTSAQQKQAQQRTLAAFLSSGGTLEKNSEMAKRLGLDKFDFAHRVDDLNTVASEAKVPSQASGSQKTDSATTKLGQQGVKKDDQGVDTQEPFSKSIKIEERTARGEPSQENGAIASVSPEIDRDPEQPTSVQGKTAERDRGVDEAIAEVLKQSPNGELGSVPPSISLQKFGQSGALARLTALRRARDARGSAPESPSLETRQVNLVEGGREPVIAQRPAANSIGTLFRAEPTGPQGLVGRSAGVSLGERVSRQVPVGSGVALNLSGKALELVPAEDKGRLSVA